MVFILFRLEITIKVFLVITAIEYLLCITITDLINIMYVLIVIVSFWLGSIAFAIFYCIYKHLLLSWKKIISFNY
jgi:hypothetical protein